MFYFSKDVNVTKLKFFDSEIDKNLVRQLLWKHEITEYDDETFKRSDHYKNVQSEAKFIVKKKPLKSFSHESLVLTVNVRPKLQKKVVE